MFIGSFATVYSAINIQTNETVALKAIEKQSTILYDREANIHLLLNHACVIELKDIAETDTFIFYVFELCKMDLFQAIDGSGFFNCQVIFEVVNQILDGMIYCHSRSVFHRDLKPENILIAKDYSVRICDFGLATCDSWSFDYGSGSLRYMGPERFIDHTLQTSIPGFSTKKSDVWSIGIILFNMITGKNPWHAATLDDPSYASYLINPRYLTIEHDLTDDFNILLRRILDPNPNTRISLIELKKEFNECVCFSEINSIDENNQVVEINSIEKESDLHEDLDSPNNSISSQLTRVDELAMNTLHEPMSNSESN